MASLIIIPRNADNSLIDLNEGKYQFGISNTNSDIINQQTYQFSNRFDGLLEGIYYYAIKNIYNSEIVSQGYNIVKRIDNNCYTRFVMNEDVVVINNHGIVAISDVECYMLEGGIYDKILPSSIKINPNNEVVVEFSPAITGKIVIC